jgi:hypothetical protein
MRVEYQICVLPGHVTFFSSAFASRKKAKPGMERTISFDINWPPVALPAVHITGQQTHRKSKFKQTPD